MRVSCCWLYAISKYGYPPNLSDTFKVIEEMANLGFEAVELEGVREKNLREVYENRERLKEKCQNVGVKVVNFCPVLPDIVNLDEEKRKKALKLFDLAVETALYFECETIQADSYTPPLKFIGDFPYGENVDFGRQFKVKVDPDFIWQNQWEVLVKSIKHCCQRAEEAHLKFCLEPRVGEIISNTDGLLRLMDQVKEENFGAVLDTGHLHAQKEILPLSVEKLGSKIFYLHVSDNDGKENQHLALGEGTIDWEGVFTALKKHKFQDYVAIDIGKVPKLDEKVKKSKAFLEKISEKLEI